MSKELPLWMLPSMDPKLSQWWCERGMRLMVHRGVLIYVGGDDERLMAAIDELPAWAIERLVCAGAARGSVSLIWSKTPPPNLADGGEMNVPDGDVWSVSSRIL